MWDLPGPGIEPVSPALAGRFLITGPPGKSWLVSLEQPSLQGLSEPPPEPCKINFVFYTAYIFYTRCSPIFPLNLVTVHLVTFTWYGDKWKLNNKNADNNNIRNSVDIKGMETNAKPWQSWRKFCENFHKICVNVPCRGIWFSGGQSWYYLLDYSRHLELCRKLLGRTPKDIYLRISSQE